jgi:hypothetical protein
MPDRPTIDADTDVEAGVRHLQQQESRGTVGVHLPRYRYVLAALWATRDGYPDTSIPLLLQCSLDDQGEMRSPVKTSLAGIDGPRLASECLILDQSATKIPMLWCFTE